MERIYKTPACPGRPQYSSVVWRREERLSGLKKIPSDSIDLGEVNLEIYVKAESDAHILLSFEGERKAFEIVIGGWRNSRSEIRVGSGERGKVLATMLHPHPPLKPGNFSDISIQWRSGEGGSNIFVQIGNEKLIAVYRAKKIPYIQKVFVATGFGNAGNWKVRVSYGPPPTNFQVLDSKTGNLKSRAPAKPLTGAKRKRQDKKPGNTKSVEELEELSDGEISSRGLSDEEEISREFPAFNDKLFDIFEDENQSRNFQVSPEVKLTSLTRSTPLSSILKRKPKSRSDGYSVISGASLVRRTPAQLASSLATLIEQFDKT